MTASGDFIASDGISLSYRQVGSGPPLLLVHGGGTDHRCFDPILDQLAERYTVTAYDRRGRGASDDAADYSLDREAADVTELAGFAGGGEPVGVLGYSYGATAALHAIAAGAAPVRALVAYEAAFDVPGMLPESEQIIALVRERRYDDAVRLFVGSTFFLSDRVVEAMTRHPMWQVSLASAPGLEWELAGVLAARLDPPAVPVPPVRYLVAEQAGNPAFRHIAELVRKTFPGSDVATVPGLPHFAMGTEPAAFISRVVEHFDRHA